MTTADQATGLSLLEVLETCRAAGVELRADVEGGTILCQPATAVDTALASAIRAHKPALLAYLDGIEQTIQRRARIIAAHIPPRRPIGHITLSDGPFLPGSCDMCADALPPWHASWVPRCALCVEALHRAIAEADAEAARKRGDH